MSFYEYQDVLAKRSISAAVKWSGFGMTFLTGIGGSILAGYSQVATGDDVEALIRRSRL
jgi:hypothetical protein